MILKCNDTMYSFVFRVCLNHFLYIKMKADKLFAFLREILSHIPDQKKDLFDISKQCYLL